MSSLVVSRYDVYRSRRHLATFSAGRRFVDREVAFGLMLFLKQLDSAGPLYITVAAEDLRQQLARSAHAPILVDSVVMNVLRRLAFDPITVDEPEHLDRVRATAQRWLAELLASSAAGTVTTPALPRASGPSVAPSARSITAQPRLAAAPPAAAAPTVLVEVAG